MKWLRNAIGWVRTFLGEVRLELKKSTWPTRGELVESTIIVVVSVALLGVFVGMSDAVLAWLVKLMVG